jgi:hypothetical protein
MFKRMKVTLTYVFKLTALTKRQILKMRIKVAKWFFFVIKKSVRLEHSPIKDDF